MDTHNSERTGRKLDQRKKEGGGDDKLNFADEGTFSKHR